MCSQISTESVPSLQCTSRTIYDNNEDFGINKMLSDANQAISVTAQLEYNSLAMNDSMKMKPKALCQDLIPPTLSTLSNEMSNEFDFSSANNEQNLIRIQPNQNQRINEGLVDSKLSLDLSTSFGELRLSSAEKILTADGL